MKKPILMNHVMVIEDKEAQKNERYSFYHRGKMFFFASVADVEDWCQNRGCSYNLVKDELS